MNAVPSDIDINCGQNESDENTNLPVYIRKEHNILYNNFIFGGVV
jgi:hypothetical protein